MVALVALAVAAQPVYASPAAIDQYTEQPPSGPVGATDLGTGSDPGPPAGSAPTPGADRARQEGAGASAPTPGADRARQEGAGAVDSGPDSTSQGAGATAVQAQRREGPAPDPVRADRQARSASAGEELPLLGYPTTSLVSALAWAAAAALLLRLGLAVYRRRSTASA